MITSPLVYLFVLAFIATSINIIQTKYNFKIFNFNPAIIVVFMSVSLLSFIGIFEFNQEIENIYTLTKINLIPAMIFLMLLEFDTIAFLKGKYFNTIGCACKMGAKRYWFLIALALFVSLLSQILSNFITVIDTSLSSIAIAFILGLIASFTKLKELNGSSEVATTMLYMFVALVGSKIA